MVKVVDRPAYVNLCVAAGFLVDLFHRTQNRVAL